jgi:hypothetical protein
VDATPGLGAAHVLCTWVGVIAAGDGRANGRLSLAGEARLDPAVCIAPIVVDLVVVVTLLARAQAAIAAENGAEYAVAVPVLPVGVPCYHEPAIASHGDRWVAEMFSVFEYDVRLVDLELVALLRARVVVTPAEHPMVNIIGGVILVLPHDHKVTTRISSDGGLAGVRTIIVADRGTVNLELPVVLWCTHTVVTASEDAPIGVVVVAVPYHDKAASSVHCHCRCR